MIYGSVCSGIEAATAAWGPLGWEPSFFSEIEKFPCAVLAHHYPGTPNYGDMTNFKEWNNDTNIDVLVGGTPCQSFSVAGLRKGLGDPRGNLMLTYLAIAAKYSPKWLVWENVPGVLSSNKGKDFGGFLWALGQLGYGFAYRVLDAQYCGVPQRRRRVFVVGCAGGWRRAAAVLFERHCLQGNSAPGKKTEKDVAGTIVSSLGRSRGAGIPPETIVATAKCLTSRESQSLDPQTNNLLPCPAEVAPTLNAAFGDKQGLEDQHINGGAGLFVPSIVHGTQDSCVSNKAFALGRNSGQENAVLNGSRVRRLTTIECERLQGFEDNFTRIPYRNKPSEKCPDGPRYKALGNSMAVPVMGWIGKRIQMVSEI